MNLHKRLLCVILCISMILSLVGCGQAESTPTQTTGVLTEETQVAVDSYLAIAQGFIDKEDFNSAIAVLEQAQAIADDERITALLAEIDAMQGTELDVELFTNAEYLQTGSVEIHSVAAQERNDGAVRYTIEYSAPSGMYIHLVEGRLDHRFDFKTTGRREKISFEIGVQDIRDLNGSLGVKFAFSEVNYYFLDIAVKWSGEESNDAVQLNTADVPEEYELSFSLWSELQDEEGAIDSYWIKDCGESWLFTVSHTLPENLAVSVCLWADGKRELFFEQPTSTNQEENILQFEISKEKLSEWKSIQLVFGSDETGYYSADAQIPFTIKRTMGTPIGQPVQTGYAIDNELKTGSYEIHESTIQRLSNGYIRYTVDMTLSKNMRVAVFLNTSSGNQFISESYSNGERTEYVFDVPEEHMDGANTLYLFVHAAENDRDRFFVWIPHFSLSASTGADELSSLIPLDYQVWDNPDETQYEVHECTAHLLKNGYVRYTLTCTMPDEVFCRFIDPPSGNNISFFYATGSNAGKQVIVMDVEESVAKTTNNLTFFGNIYDESKRFTVGIDNSPIADPELIVEIPKIAVTLLHPIADEFISDEGSRIDSITLQQEQEANTLTRIPQIDTTAAMNVDTSMISALDVNHSLKKIQASNGIQPYGEYWAQSLPTDADLSGNPQLMYSLTFSNETVFPDKMPAGFDSQTLLEWGKIPGLNVDVLHKLGYTGKGAVIAYVDQPVNDHSEYVGDNFHIANNTNAETSMHGPAVLSLLAGKEIGTAPEAEVWFYGHAAWEADQSTHAECLYQIIEQNKSLPDSERITMVAFSDNIDPSEKNAKAFEDAVKACEEEGIMVWFCGEYASASFLALSDKNNYENVIPDQWYGSAPELVYVPAGSRTTATGERGEYIYWASGGLSWTMPYVLGIYAIVNEIDPSLSQDDLRTMIVKTAYVKDGMRIINPVEFVAVALEGVGKTEEAAILRNVAKNNAQYTYAIMNKKAMTTEDITAAENYLKEISDSQVLVVDASGMETAQELYTILQADNIQRGGKVVGIQIFGNVDLVPSFDIGYKVRIGSEVDDAGRMLTDLFYGNFNNAVKDIGKDYNVMDHFEKGWNVQLVPEWKVARLPLAKGEFKTFFDKYMDFAATAGLGQQTLVNFSNPIFANSNHTDDMGYFLNRLGSEFGIDLGDYRLYGNLLGQYPVTTDVLDGFTAENLTAENQSGVCEFIINTHGQRNNVDKCWFEGGQEKRESLMNMTNINSILAENPYYLDMWTCNNGEGMKDNMTTAALSGNCVGMLSNTHIISNNGVNNQASLQAMTESNFYWFYLHYLKALSEGASRSDAFFEAQKAYGNALIVDSQNELRGEGNYQFNLCNLLGYHNFGVLEPNAAFSCINSSIS